MSYFWPGVAAIWGALAAGTASLVLYLRADRGRPHLIPLARSAYAAFATCIVAACGVLLALLLQHRFDVSYVNAYSARDLPLHFLISSFWGGQEGSFLLWCFWGAIIGLVVWRSAKEQEAPVMVVYLATFLGIVAILCRQSPFRVLPGAPPADGVGLNPLLQDPWMVIHPPVMFSGFASLSVPFAFAIAALWKKRWDGWVTRAIPWALFTFVTLGTAILMGGYWAYKTLGWGGYWGWDPVENTSLVPWLFTAALVHGMFLQRVKKRHRKVNLILACVSYVAILYGTFLTRSGVLADFSVHSFIDLGITGWLVGILLGFLVGSAALIGWRWRSIPSVQEEDPALLSRSVLFILGIAAFCALGFVILLGTSAPLLTRLTGNPSQVQASFYNQTTSPAAALLVLLAALVPFVSWKGDTAGSLARSARRSLLVGGAILVVAAIAGARDPLTLVLLFFAAFSADMNLRAVTRKARTGKFGGAGGYLAHVGVGIFLAGVAVSGVYAKSTRMTLPAGKPVRAGDSTLTFLRVVPGTATSKQAMEVRVESAGGRVGYLYPKMYVNSKTNQLMANPAIRNSPLFDFYVAPQSYDPGQAEQFGREVRLTKGTTTNIEGTGFTFREFNADRAAMLRGEKSMLVLTELTVTPPDGTKHDITARYVFHTDGQPADSPEVAIPGLSNAFLQVLAVSPTDGAVVLKMRGVSRDPAAEHQAATVESLSVDVTRKPLISLVWGGFYVMMAGALLALVKRSREARRAVAALEAEPGPRIPAGSTAPGTAPAVGPAVPVHLRSPL
ncbi:MAG: cytochrome c biogenesis protein CcsA [Acidobacteria bacterium]|nr:cytochrome c biogenesis protein CcsA [Acidobacteriota bacterium]MCA1617256.1 cytochrome c biogenesis protein CcsA [Acidobacteriota bacterium]